MATLKYRNQNGDWISINNQKIIILHLTEHVDRYGYITYTVTSISNNSELNITNNKDFVNLVREKGIDNFLFYLEKNNILHLMTTIQIDEKVNRLRLESASLEYIDGFQTYTVHKIDFYAENANEIEGIYDDTDVSGGPCLIEGTLINMADGTKKAIENIEPGDMILSYNPTTESIVPAVAIQAYPTGLSRDFVTYHFSNGKYITAYKVHGIYNKKWGTIADIQDLNQDATLISSNNEAVSYCHKDRTEIPGTAKKRYNLISSNNLYFANDILLGHKPFRKNQFISRKKIQIPLDIKEVWDQDVQDYDAFNLATVSSNFNEEIKEINTIRIEKQRLIQKNKKLLNDSDYKNQKRVEGLIEDAEWEEYKKQRASWRKEINDNEEAYFLNEQRYQEKLAKYRNHQTPKTLFDKCCDRDNDIFEKVKNYFNK